MGLRSLQIFLFLQDRLQSSESDVYRRQILTTKVDPRALRVKYILDEADTSRLSNNMLEILFTIFGVFVLEPHPTI